MLVVVFRGDGIDGDELIGRRLTTVIRTCLARS